MKVAETIDGELTATSENRDERLRLVRAIDPAISAEGLDEVMNRRIHEFENMRTEVHRLKAEVGFVQKKLDELAALVGGRK